MGSGLAPRLGWLSLRDRSLELPVGFRRSTKTIAIVLFDLSSVFAFLWCSEVAQPGTDTPNVSTELSSPITLLFIPFYVPPGARACDSAFSLASYIGTWTESFWSAYVENVLHSSPRRGSSVPFRSLVPGLSGSELRKFNTVWKTFTSTELLSGSWTPGTRF